MVGFRNVVGHDYMNIDKKMVYSILTEGTQDIKGLVSKIVKRFLWFAICIFHFASR